MTFDGYGDGWVIDSTDPRLAVLWPGAEDQDDVEFPLYVAMLQCAAFAPAFTGDAPENYVAAQILQAKALVRAGVVGTNDQSGYDNTVAVFPMDWTVKALLRPKKAKPYFGGYNNG